MASPIIVDAHQDIAWNKVAMERDFFESVAAKRQREGTSPAHGEGSATVGFKDLLDGNVRIVFATLYVAPQQPDKTSKKLSYSTPEEAHDQAMEQVKYYQSLESDSRVTIIRKATDLDRVVNADKPNVGLVILMEGADPIITPAEVPDWFAAGVRIVGPSWSRTRYAGGTRAPGGLTALGRELMPQLERAGIILDTSHMAEQSFYEALELFHGNVIASHSNCREFVNTDRQLSDEMIRLLIKRDAVIGTVMYNRFLIGEWDTSAKKDAVSFEDALRHMVRICDIAGDTLHVGIGSDFDGGFGMESTPKEIDTVADLQKLANALAPKFSDGDIANILGGNWIRLVRRSLPSY